MFTRSAHGTLLGPLLLVPLIALTGCEGYEQPGGDEAGKEHRQTETRQQRMETEMQRQEQETEVRQQGREAEPTTRDRSNPPTAGETDESSELMSMTELSVQVPQDLRAGTYTLSCPVPESALRQQAGQQPTREDVQLRITVRQDQQNQSGTNR